MINPEKIYEDLMNESTNIRIQKTLTAIHNVCKEQQERGSKDFSVKTISKIGEDKGVPRSQSIRNKTGEKYRKLIEAWQLSNPNLIKKVTSGRLNWVDDIPDATTRFLVNDLIADLSKSRSENNLLKSIKKLDIDMRDKVSNVPSISDHSNKPAFTHSELESLKHAIDNAALSKRGWTIGERGNINDINNKVIFKNGFAHAVRKVLTVND